jgi:hypothetical protein
MGVDVNGVFRDDGCKRTHEEVAKILQLETEIVKEQSHRSMKKIILALSEDDDFQEVFGTLRPRASLIKEKMARRRRNQTRTQRERRAFLRGDVADMNTEE